MIKEMQGDLLESKAAVIVHGVAPNDPFAQGLAHSLGGHQRQASGCGASRVSMGRGRRSETRWRR